MRSSHELVVKDDFEALTGVAPFVRDRIARIVKGFNKIDRAVVYGSRARGDFAPYSDIDIALYGDSVTWDEVSRVKDAIDNSFIVFPIDVTAVATLPNDSTMRHTIDRDGITIYDRASPPSLPITR